MTPETQEALRMLFYAVVFVAPLIVLVLALLRYWLQGGFNSDDGDSDTAGIVLMGSTSSLAGSGNGVQAAEVEVADASARNKN